jgi:hypothetical protein
MLSNRVPMRWPSGPLEIAIRQKAKDFAAEEREILEAWHNSSALDVVGGSVVTCLVVTWASGLPEDAAQQQTLRSLIDAARQRNLDVVGWVDGKIDPNATIAAAKTAGLTAVAWPNFTGASDFVIPWGDRDHAPWNTSAPVLPIAGNVWPGVAAGRRSASAGPTALPWLDTNSWFLQLAHARTDKPVWIVCDPPGAGEVVPGRNYGIAICDVEMAGGRWVMSLDAHLRAGLIKKDGTAETTWKSMSDAIRFFDRHKEWKSYQSLGAVGVVSDFAGANFGLGGEILNALSRRDLLCRVFRDTGRALPRLPGVKVVLRPDAAKPAEPVRTSLLSYVEEGGVLVTSPSWGSDGKPLQTPNADFTVRAVGKGRIAVAREELADPWDFVTKAQAFISHADATAKLFNASASGGFRYSGAADGKRALLQILSYANYGGGRAAFGGANGGLGRGGRAAPGGFNPGGRASGFPGAVPLSSLATAWTRDKYRAAQLWTIEAAGPSAVEVARCEDGGTEYHLPAMSTYLALDFEA